MDKDDPRYREMKERMRVQSRDRAIVIVLLVLITVVGLIWLFVINP